MTKPIQQRLPGRTPLAAVQWEPTARVFFPLGSRYNIATRWVGSRFSLWKWLHFNRFNIEGEVMI
jgi:hypothetical protein